MKPAGESTAITGVKGLRYQLRGIGNGDEEAQLLLGLIEIAEALLGVDFGREPRFVLAFEAAGEQSESCKREIAGIGRRTAANPSKTGWLPEPVLGTGCQIGTDGLLVTYNADVRQ